MTNPPLLLCGLRRVAPVELRKSPLRELRPVVNAARCLAKQRQRYTPARPSFGSSGRVDAALDRLHLTLSVPTEAYELSDLALLSGRTASVVLRVNPVSNGPAAPEDFVGTLSTKFGVPVSEA
jgi:hypothetical protein